MPLHGTITTLYRQLRRPARTSVLPKPRSLELLSCTAASRSSVPCEQVVMLCRVRVMPFTKTVQCSKAPATIRSCQPS
jgi:hypothetical protein